MGWGKATKERLKAAFAAARAAWVGERDAQRIQAKRDLLREAHKEAEEEAKKALAAGMQASILYNAEKERADALADDRLRGLKIAHKYTLDTQTVEEACTSLVEIITAQRGRADRLEAALREAKGVMWMAEQYADGGGYADGGPEMRDYRQASAAIDAALAAQPAPLE